MSTPPHDQSTRDQNPDERLEDTHPRAHIEVLASALLRTVGSRVRPRSIPLLAPGTRALQGLIAGAVRAGEDLAGDMTRRAAAAAPRPLRTDPIVGPWLQRIRTGTSLRDDLAALFGDLLRRVSSGDDVLGQPDRVTPDQGPDDDTGPVATQSDRTPLVLVNPEDQTGTDEVPLAVAAIGDALADGIRQAAERGGVIPARSAEVTAWALTSLLMTLVMRSREGEDVDELLEVAVASITELLGSA